MDSPPQIFELGKNRQAALVTRGLELRFRHPNGHWTCLRAIGWEEIRAAYRYDRRNWTPLFAAIALAILTAFVLLIAAAFLHWSAALTTGSILLTVCVLVALGLARVFRYPESILHVDAYSGPLTLPGKDAALFQQLSAGIAAIHARNAFPDL